MKIDNRILDILENSRIEENVLYLPNIQLDRADYMAVNKVLELLGGKWNRKVRGHVFDHCPDDDIEAVLLVGEVIDSKKVFQFFPTPRKVAEYLCDLAEINSNSFVLEPSCGKGDLADVIWERNPGLLFGVELNEAMDDVLKDKPYDTAVGVDFLTEDIKGHWDRIIMNPPFAKQQEIDHVLKAFNILAPGGILVSIMSNSPFFRTDKKSVAFREFLEESNAIVEELPEGAFKESGTMVKTCMVKIRKSIVNAEVK